MVVLGVVMSPKVDDINVVMFSTHCTKLLDTLNLAKGSSIAFVVTLLKAF